MMVKEGEFRNTGVRLISFYWKQMSASGLQGLSHLFSLHPLLCTAGVSWLTTMQDEDTYMYPPGIQNAYKKVSNPSREVHSTPFIDAEFVTVDSFSSLGEPWKSTTQMKLDTIGLVVARCFKDVETSELAWSPMFVPLHRRAGARKSPPSKLSKMMYSDPRRKLNVWRCEWTNHTRCNPLPATAFGLVACVILPCYFSTHNAQPRSLE